MPTVQVRVRISDVHREALRRLEEIESQSSNILLSNLIFERSFELGVWPAIQGGDNGEATPNQADQ